MTNNDKWNELDNLILEALKEKPELDLPLTFTDALLNKVERRLTWRELIREFAFKTGIVTGALLVLAACLVFPAQDPANPFLELLLVHWKPVAGIGFLLLFTWFSDQVVLKFFTSTKATK